MHESDKIDVEQMSFDELHAAHIALWDWLAHHPEAKKSDWSDWEDYDDDYLINNCFDCVYASMFRIDSNDNLCDFCPIKDWSCVDYKGIVSHCSQCHSLYKRWDSLMTPLTDRAELAAQIRDLPWVEQEVTQ
jgi:hypothetical protein